ncbi:probable dolichol-phosphate mannosyltransferase [Cyanidioschyzon merolae strain 10D]|jgi:glycosyltransferase involved in cell wall biosynthesis|uniref:Probable dolichol-phosphate mannosyltransferase n=1 Tax=Cyanidioschyzon merolae (strain NIES-3377 / 10D) TaxID=280699 RepID=M1VFM3_CYAM1|nr:probable dolichol-phosphate mannosyltransferase [Cyanidioschyzon merolae strain 10D]BAM79333.1 probable dolichol-phosphate mannosyltransferase [Cyanidioschyzon merolae strain 10D]|eukprot:XP_005535619.1 probable dolichol-phosphate mannosyltransferase [Cyanidioschyzon merolae strain 10D]
MRPGFIVYYKLPCDQRRLQACRYRCSPRELGFSSRSLSVRARHEEAPSAREQLGKPWLRSQDKGSASVPRVPFRPLRDQRMYKYPVSVVIPLYNESEALVALLRALYEALETESAPEQYRGQVEVVLVDDGSTDGTTALLRNILRDEYNAPAGERLLLPSHLVGVFFRRNYGQTAALAAGFDAAQGEVVVTMDGDLQQEPQDIFPLLEKLKQASLDVVSGWRRQRRDDPIRTWLSQVANALIRTATGVHEVNDLGCSLKAYRADILSDIQLFGQMHRFIPVLAKIEGARLGQMEVRHRPRRYGASKYGLGRTFRVICDLVLLHYLTRQATRPMHWFGTIALVLGAIAVVLALLPNALIMPLLGMIAGVSNLSRNPLGRLVSRTALLVLSASVTLTALIFLGLGIVAEIAVRAWYAQEAAPAGRRPLYRIREHLERHQQQRAVSSFGFRTT